jgi:hypothetical protein
MPRSDFGSIPLTARNHFTVNVNAAVFALVAHIRSLDDAGPLEPSAFFERHPFLSGYLDAISPHLPAGLRWRDARGWWESSIRGWERGAGTHLPLVALERCGLAFGERTALVLAGLVEEDARFGSVFAELQRPHEARRPTLGTAAAVIGAAETDPWSLRASLARSGAVEMTGDGPMAEQTLSVPRELWTVLRGTSSGSRSLDWAEVRGLDDLDPVSDAVIPADLRVRIGQIADRVGTGQGGVVLLRGSASSGRRRILGSLARALGRGGLFVDADRLDPGRWRRLRVLATALGAVPVVRFDLVPGETVDVPELAGDHDPFFLAVGGEGGLRGSSVEGAIRLELPRLGPDERRLHWREACPGFEFEDLDLVAERFRLPAGHIRRVARAASASASLDGRSSLTVGDVAASARTLNRERLDTLAQRLDPVPGWDRLIVDDDVRQRLSGLELRCRHRERLFDHVGRAFTGAANVGVRALITGPSGTGKTLAARVLAAELDMDLYRIDLAAVVDKYIGETEKNLHRILTTAEELDVVLLIDEGDSLLGNRTEVRTANDRFANLETNYLLQRLESYQGVLLVTTNAADRIDPAFQRRMDVVLGFVEPEPAERLAIWQMHLAEDHRVDPGYLDELSVRAEMTGGQIRNATLHAALLALEERRPVDTGHLRGAVATEYGKAGAVSPFQQTPEPQRQPRSEAFMEALP